MTGRSAPPKNATSATGIAGLLLALLSVPALASTGVDVHCPESDKELNTVEISEPALKSALKIEVADNTVDSEDGVADEITDDPAESTKAATPRLSSSGNDDGSTPRDEAPPTATRLPGVSDSDLPRFRRQMYRTDI